MYIKLLAKHIGSWGVQSLMVVGFPGFWIVQCQSSYHTTRNNGKIV